MLAKSKAPALRFSASWSTINLVSLTAVLSFSFLSLTVHIPYAWWFVVGLSFVSSILVFFPLDFFTRNANRLAILPAAFISLSVVIQNLLFSPLWDKFGPKASMPVCKILQLTLGKEMLCEVFNVRFLALVHPTTSFFIGKGCGGFDALILFTALSSTYFFMKEKRPAFFLALPIFLIGCLLMYTMNILRMVIIFLVAVTSAKITSRYHATNFAIELAHTHVGWVLYLVTSAAYLKGVESLLKVRPSHLRKSPNVIVSPS